MFKGIMTPARRRYNALMARLRIFVENVMGNNHCLLNKLAFKQKLKLGGRGLETLYPVATFLFNVHTCLYGNQFTRMVYRKTELALRRVPRDGVNSSLTVPLFLKAAPAVASYGRCPR